MSTEKEPIHYDINSLERLVNVVNKKNIERLSIDLLIWLNYLVDAVDKIRADHPAVCEGKSNWELFEPTFTWIDDGKNEITGIKIINKENGEVTEIKFDKK